MNDTLMVLLFLTSLFIMVFGVSQCAQQPMNQNKFTPNNCQRYCEKLDLDRDDVKECFYYCIDHYESDKE